MAVDPRDRALARLPGRRIDQRDEARGHGVAFRVFVAPAVQVEDDVVCVEVVAIVPLHALTDMQDVFGGVVVDVPAFKKHRLEGEVLGVFHKGLEHLPGNIAHLAPVEGARVLHVLDQHRDLEHAARLGLLGLRRNRSSEPDHAVGPRHGQTECAGDSETRDGRSCLTWLARPCAREIRAPAFHCV